MSNQTPLIGEIAHTLRAEGFDASEDGTGRGTPIVPVAYRTSGNCGAWETGEKVDALTTGTDPNSHILCFSCKDHGADATDDLSPTLRAIAGGQMAVAFDMRGRDGGAQFEGPHETANIRAASGGSSRSYVAQQWAVRRLTPAECEILQGYPPGHTLIEHGSRRTLAQDEADYLAAKGAHIVVGNDGKLRTNAAADGPRYKALGNAWAVACVRPVAMEIYTRLQGAGKER